MAKCRTIKGKEICPQRGLFQQGYLGRGPFQEGFSDTSLIVFARFPTDPPNNLKTLLDIFINSQALAEGGSGNFELTKEIQFHRMDTEANSKIGWMGLRNAVSINAPPWTQATGFSNDGLTKVMETNVRQTDLDSGNNGFGFVCGANRQIAGGRKTMIGCQTGLAIMRVDQDNTGNQIRYNAQTNSNRSAALDGGLFVSGKHYMSVNPIVDVVSGDLWVNGILVNTGVIVTRATGASTFILGADNDDGVLINFCDADVWVSFWVTDNGFDYLDFFTNLDILINSL